MDTDLKVEGTVLPIVRFSAWHRWTERNEIDDSAFPGIYAIALDMTKDGQCKLTDGRIIYFGQTSKQTLKIRWNEFNDAAFKGAKGLHSGGETFAAKVAVPSDRMYVSGCAPLIREQTLRSAFIRFLERKLVLEFVLENNRLPACNKQ